MRRIDECVGLNFKPCKKGGVCGINFGWCLQFRLNKPFPTIQHFNQKNGWLQIPNETMRIQQTHDKNNHWHDDQTDGCPAIHFWLKPPITLRGTLTFAKT